MSKLTKELAPFDNQVSFDQNPLPTRPCNYGIFARKGMGKTTLLLNILTRKASPWYKHFNKIFLISPTASKDDKMNELVEDIGEEQYYDELSPNTLADIIQKIDAFTEEFKSKKKNKGKKPNFCIIYDDVIHELKRNKIGRAHV